jgi:hypothetical protein
LAALGVLGKGGYDQFVAPWVAECESLAASQEALRKLEERIDKGHGTSYGDGYMDGLRQGERASQEKERQLREALEQIEQLDRMGHNSEVAAEMGYIARVTLDSTQTHGVSDA